MSQQVVGLLMVVSSFVLVGSLRAEPGLEVTYDGKPLSAWVSLLRSKNEKERAGAIKALGAAAVQSRAAVAVLVGALLDAKELDLDVRLQSLRSLGPAAVAPLTQALWSEDVRRRLLATLALGELAGHARPAVAALIELLQDSEPFVRQQAVRTLAQIGDSSATPALRKRFRDDGDEQTRLLSAGTLVQFYEPADQLLPVVVPLLKDERWHELAFMTLSLLGPEAVGAVPALKEVLTGKAADARKKAVDCLGAIGPPAKDAAPALRAILADEQRSDEHLGVARTLWRIARDRDVAAALRVRLKQKEARDRVETAELLWRVAKDPDAITALSEIVADENNRARGRAFLALMAFGTEARAARPAFLGLLKDAEPSTVQAAVIALGRLREHAKPNVAELNALADHQDARIRLAVAAALWRIEKDEKVIPRVASVLKEGESHEFRSGAAELLGHIGPEARAGLHALQAALEDKQAFVRLRAAEALWLVAADPTGLPVLTALLADGDANVRNEAALALGGTFGAQARSAVPALVPVLWDEDPHLRSVAAEALGRIGPAAAKAVMPLTALLRDDQQGDPNHSAAAEALGLIGPDARAALPVLLARLDHSDRYVRVCAARALWQIDRNSAGKAHLRAGLDDRSFRVRVVAAEALWFMQEDARALPTLIAVLHDAEVNGRMTHANEKYMAARALGRIGPPAKVAVPMLRALLQEEDFALREMAADALKRIASR